MGYRREFLNSIPRATIASLFAFSAAFSAAFFAAFPAHAYEVDNFTGRNALLSGPEAADALPALDAKINQIIERAIEIANTESPGHCNRVMLRQEVARWTGPDPISFLEFWATFTKSVKQSKVALEDSIYAGVPFKESPGMWFAGIGRSLNLNGHIVGTDKIGHFFMQGLDYFKRVQLEGESLDTVLRTEHGEDGVWGLKMTGVKSYADMAANYQGYRFWSELYMGAKPYARCEQERRWVRARTFTWADYVSDAWDEAINCSEYNPALAARVRKALDARGLKCPIDLKRCNALAALEYSEHFQTPVCRQGK